MFEIKENRRILPDGTQITTYSRDVVSCNILEVEAVPRDTWAVIPDTADALTSALKTPVEQISRFILSGATPMKASKYSSAVTASSKPSSGH